MSFASDYAALAAGPYPARSTGQVRDVETGLDYFGARYMASAQGRFTTNDPIKITFGHVHNPQKWNLYSYVVNNPLGFFDPDGKAEVRVTVRAYIPNAAFEAPKGLTWLGDGRGTSTSGDASHRVSSSFILESDPRKRQNPLVYTARPTSSGSQVSVDVGNTGGLIPRRQTATAVAAPRAEIHASRDIQGNAIAQVSLTGSDPLLPWAPPVKADLRVSLDPAATVISVEGSLTSYPAFEVLAEKDGKTVVVFEYQPEGVTNSPETLLFDWIFGRMRIGGSAFLPSSAFIPTTPTPGKK